ncbi:hypothetical protein OMO38_08635 [Chryseobacterium sp. 09-1422]|uniref:DUF3592 domain-containing protein n=1 Tax=Chryseobacterium kimseyorum TaxID=2984028 RepID=A0ABT3HY51_9FLAO|nr:hypothetical protein [Chryseobacterium kimseyorum]MCW3168593.1 hypothetical protein [Chryseobacterium kimseyorum]
MYTIIFTTVILVLLYFKKRRKKQEISVKVFILPAIMILFVSSIFFFLGGRIVSTLYSSIFDKKYDAKVVKYDYTDGDSDSAPAAIAVVEFKNDKNQTLQKSIGYGTSHPVEIGKTIKISYHEGDRNVKNLSFSEMKLLIGIVSVFFTVFTIAMIAVIMHVLDRDLSVIWKIVGGIFIYLVIPGGMLFFIVALSWVMWEYLQGRKDDTPIWALGVCSLFVTLQIPALLGYFKMLFEKKSMTGSRSKSVKTKIRLSKFSKRIPK